MMGMWMKEEEEEEEHQHPLSFDYEQTVRPLDKKQIPHDLFVHIVDSLHI
jgi:hypothetical protein